MSDARPITPSPRNHGHYVIGNHELANGDIIEWLEANQAYAGKIEYTYRGCFARTPSGPVALRELAQLRRVGVVRETFSA